MSADVFLVFPWLELPPHEAYRTAGGDRWPCLVCYRPVSPIPVRERPHVVCSPECATVALLRKP